MKQLQKIIGKTAMATALAGLMGTGILFASEGTPSGSGSGSARCPAGYTLCTNGTAAACCAPGQVCQIKNIDLTIGPIRIVDKSVSCCSPSAWNLWCTI